jgi:hypothetical protein
VLSLRKDKFGTTDIQRDVFDTRKSILSAVVKYLEADKIDILRIDKAYIDQSYEKNEAETMIFPGLVHNGAAKVVELLFTPIYTNTVACSDEGNAGNPSD